MKGRNDELPCSSKQVAAYDSFTSRKIPEFSGTGGEDEFESWKLRITEFLKQSMFAHYSEERKISTIKLGVCSTAAMVLEANSRNVHTVKDLIEVLSKVYGVDKKSSDCRAIQLEKESIRQYHARLKAYLVASGMVQGTDNFNNWMLKSFIEGIKPEIKVKLQAALPYDIEEAFRKAQTAETLLLSMKVKKAEIKSLATTEAEMNDENEEMVANINSNSQSDRNGFQNSSGSKFLDERKYSNDNNSDMSKPKYHNESYNNSQNSNGTVNINTRGGANQQISIQCFACNRVGHSFERCWSIDEIKRNEIRERIKSCMTKSTTGV
jgi:hypothetical protein